MKITFEDATRVLDLQHVQLRHAVAIQEFTGLTVLAWQERLSVTGGVTKADFIADAAAAVRRTPMFTDPGWITGMAAAHWLMLAQAGEDPPPLDDDYDCDVLGFCVAFIVAFAGEVQKRAADKPDPTVPPGRPDQSSRRTTGPKAHPPMESLPPVFPTGS